VIYASPSVSVTSMDPPTGQARASFHLERDTLDFQELVVVLQMALETVCSFAKPQGEGSPPIEGNEVRRDGHCAAAIYHVCLLLAPPPAAASITMRGSCLTEEERTTWCEELGVDDAAGPVAFHASSEQLTSLPWFAERAQRMLIADRSVVGDTCIVGVAETNLIDSTGGCQAAALWARPAVGDAPAGSPLGAPPTDDSASPPSVCLAAVFIDHIPCTREALPPWVEPALASIKWKVFGLELTATDTARGHFGVLELRLRARGGSAGSLEAIVLHVVSDGKGRPLKAKRGAKALRDAAEGALEAVKRTCPGALGSSHDVQLSLAVPVVAAEIASLTARSRSAAVEWAARAALGPGRVGSPETRRQIEALLFRAAQENSTGAGSS